MAGSVRKRGTTWYFVVDVGRDESGKRKQKFKGGFNTKKAAQEALRQLQNQLDSGFLPEASKITFGGYTRRWLEHHRTQVEPKTWKRYESLVRLYLVPPLGHMALAKVRPAHVQAVLDGIKGRSPRTIQHVRAVASKAFTQAVAWELVASNPVSATHAPRADRPDLAVLTVEDIQAILDVSRGTEWEAPILLAVFTGARRGEILGLRWCEVDLSKRRIRIASSLERVDGEYRMKEPKTQRSRRSIAIPALLVDRLSQLRVEQGTRRLAFGSAWHRNDLVCEKGNGSPIDPDSLSKAFKRFAKKAGVPKARLHDLRHAAVTVMMERGVHPSIVSRSLGHASEAFTMAVYGHMADEHLDEAASALADVYTVA